MAIFKDGGNGNSDRSAWDRKRHRRLIEDAIKKNVGDIIADESIIGQSKDKKIKIPIKGIKEWQFVYGKNTSGSGAGDGSEQRGQVIGKTGQGQQGAGQGPQAGSDAGEDIFETEISLEEIVNYLFEDLQLPHMERKKFALLESTTKTKRFGFQRHGIPPRLDKKRSMIERIKRVKGIKRVENELGVHHVGHVDDQGGEREPFRTDDLRYRRTKEEHRRHSNAVVLCIMDVSGSMDQTKKYLARSFYFLLYQFLRWKYEEVEVAFIAHTTEAKEVSEREFFHKGESGGTFISSGYNKALQIIEERYNPEIWNIYAFHCSDGDNWSEDNVRAVTAAVELCKLCNLFGYGEIVPTSYGIPTIRKEFEKNLQQFKNFAIVNINKKDDLWPAFKKLLDVDAKMHGEEKDS